MASNPRFQWLGEQDFGRTQALLAGADLLVVSSRAEGGPAVVSEAIAAGTPLLSTPLPLVHELLGEGFAGVFDFGDEEALGGLLRRCEEDRELLESLRAEVRAAADRVRPEVERARLAELISELGVA